MSLYAHVAAALIDALAMFPRTRRFLTSNLVRGDDWCCIPLVTLFILFELLPELPEPAHAASARKAWEPACQESINDGPLISLNNRVRDSRTPRLLITTLTSYSHVLLLSAPELRVL